MPSGGWIPLDSGPECLQCGERDWLHDEWNEPYCACCAETPAPEGNQC